jgi:hypothetical protein
MFSFQHQSITILTNSIDISGKWRRHTDGAKLLVVDEGETYLMVQTDNPKNHRKLIVDGNKIIMVGVKRGHFKD